MLDTLIPAGWLQNYFYTIQKLNTFQNRNVKRYNLRIFTRIFQPKIGRKIIRIIQPWTEKQYSIILIKNQDYMYVELLRPFIFKFRVYPFLK